VDKHAKKLKAIRKAESRFTAKLARLLVAGGLGCPDTVEELGVVVGTLPNGRDLLSRIPSLSDSGLRQVRGQVTAFHRQLQKDQEQFTSVSDALRSGSGGSARLVSLSGGGMRWQASVEIPGPEHIHYCINEADQDSLPARLVAEVLIDLGHPLSLPAIGPADVGTLRRKVADEAESLHQDWVTQWRRQHVPGSLLPAYSTLGDWSDGESDLNIRGFHGSCFDRRLEERVNELLENLVLAGVADERYGDRVREAFWDSDQAVELQCVLEEWWRALPVPGGRGVTP
jgi:hypothetical protein